MVGGGRRLELKSAAGPLSKILFDFDRQGGQAGRFQVLEQLFAQPAGDQFDGGLLDGQQGTFVFGKDPASLFVANFDFVLLDSQQNQRMPCRQQHAMIQCIAVFLQGIPQGNEVEHKAVFVEFTFDLGCDPKIVPVNPFAEVPDGDEMSCGEHQVILGDFHGKCLAGRGGLSHLCQIETSLPACLAGGSFYQAV